MSQIVPGMHALLKHGIYHANNFRHGDISGLYDMGCLPIMSVCIVSAVWSQGYLPVSGVLNHQLLGMDRHELRDYAIGS